MLRKMFFGFAALTACLMSRPATAADFDKYVPEDAKYFMHINVPRLFASEMVRKAVPMAFDKYGDQLVDQLVTGIGMAKGMNPAMPDVGEDQIKGMLKMAADPKVIAGICDNAGPVVTDIVVAGSEQDGMPKMVFVIKSPMIKAEEFTQGMAMMGALPNMPFKVETIKKSKGTVFAMDIANAPVKMFFSVPEPGVLHMCMDEVRAEKAFEAASKPGAKLGELMAKRNKDDFMFFAGVGSEGDDFVSTFGNITLDKNFGGNVNRTLKEEAQAKDEAEKINHQFGEMFDQFKGMLGEKADALKEHLDKAKATVNGKTVNAVITIPGSVLDKLLAKD